MTDTKSNVTAQLPYKRVSSPAHFRALIPGRRKAVEVSVLVSIVQPLNSHIVGSGTCPL
jgi:hypothetical protein